MKKSLILILIIIVVATVFFILNYKEYEINQIDLNNFNFTFTNEYINFLQGVNGTGKTTLILCILEFLKFYNFEFLLYQNIDKYLHNFLYLST